MIKQVEKQEQDCKKKLEQIAKLEQKLFQGSAYSEEMLMDMLHYFEQYQMFYWEEEKQLIAYALVLDSIDCFEILKIGVKEQYRRQGLGKQLLEQIATKDIFLEVRENNQTAIDFYRSCGFQEMGKRKGYYSDTGEAAIIMKLEVNYES